MTPAAFRYMCATAAALNIAALMAANLAGFVVGLDGVAGACSCQGHLLVALAMFAWVVAMWMWIVASLLAAAVPSTGLLHEMLRSPRFVAATLVTFFSAANVMLALRDWEAARPTT